MLSFQALNWKPLEKNTLRGFFDLQITSPDMVIILRGASYHERDGSRWVAMPAKPYKDKSGKETWANIVDWPDQGSKTEFMSLALGALDRDLLNRV